MTQVRSSAVWPYEETSCVLCPRAKTNGTLVCSGLCVMHGLAELSVRLHAWCCQCNLRGLCKVLYLHWRAWLCSMCSNLHPATCPLALASKTCLPSCDNLFADMLSGFY